MWNGSPLSFDISQVYNDNGNYANRISNAKKKTRYKQAWTIQRTKKLIAFSFSFSLYRIPNKPKFMLIWYLWTKTRYFLLLLCVLAHKYANRTLFNEPFKWKTFFYIFLSQNNDKKKNSQTKIYPAAQVSFDWVKCSLQLCTVSL